MKADNFFVIEVVDKLSRIFILMFAGIILGAVVGLAFHYGFRADIVKTLGMLILYYVIFTSYVFVTNTRRRFSSIEIYKDRLALISQEAGQVCERKEIYYDEIKLYKISSLSDKKTLELQNPNRDKFSLREFGYSTLIETQDGEKIEFATKKSDGVLIYSPAYVYRMLDVKRCVKDFPLVLERFDSRRDTEDFDAQFRYYDENEKNLSLWKNENYITSLLKYTVFFVSIAILVALFIAYIMWADIKDQESAMKLLTATFSLLFTVTALMYLVASMSSFFGGIVNRINGKKIKSVIEA